MYTPWATTNRYPLVPGHLPKDERSREETEGKHQGKGQGGSAEA